jgi:hypothetical protein
MLNIPGEGRRLKVKLRVTKANNCRIKVQCIGGVQSVVVRLGKARRHRPQSCDYCNRLYKIVGLHGGVELRGSRWSGMVAFAQTKTSFVQIKDT